MFCKLPDLFARVLVLLHGVAVVVVELFLPLGLVCPLVYCVWAVEERCGRDFQLGTHAM